VIDIGQVEGIDEFTTWLEDLPMKPALIIYETYVIDPNVKQGGTDVPASQVIGAIRSYGQRHSIVCLPQLRTVLLIGYRWAGIKPLPKSKHKLSHQYDAFAHGIYYLIKNKIRELSFE
jgi:hypothetical protein